MVVLPFALTLALFATLPGIVSFSVARWCLERGWRTACLLAMAVLGAGVVYGVLRFTGLVVFPGDNHMSYNFFDASYRDDGFHILYPCGALFLGGAAALWAGRRGGSRADAVEAEENQNAI